MLPPIPQTQSTALAGATSRRSGHLSPVQMGAMTHFEQRPKVLLGIGMGSQLWL